MAHASTSTATVALHSAWNPYSVLAPSTRRKHTKTAGVLSERPLNSTLSIPDAVAEERLAGKYLQLDAPAGKMSDQRKEVLAVREKERSKKLASRNCGLVGRRRRTKGDMEKEVRYEAVIPMHTMWLGYMTELLGLPFLLPTNTPPTPHSLPEQTTAVIVPTMPPRSISAVSTTGAGIQELKINVGNLHTKLVKAEFVGCILSVKRCKNPSLVNLKGLVLQETQGTFKIVTASSVVKVLPKKGTIFTFSLPLPPAPSSGPSSSSDSHSTTRQLSFDIFGDAFCYRSAERVGKKWKAGSGSGGVELV